jgi:hypothetical protein
MSSRQGQRLPLHDIDNAQGFIRALVGRSGLNLRWDEREDLEQHLLVLLWELSLRFESGGISFATWVGTNGQAPHGRLAAQAPGTNDLAVQDPHLHPPPNRARLSPTPSIPSEIDWSNLSPEGAWTVTNLAWPMSCGFSKREVAVRVGEKTSWVTRQLDALEAELLRLSR